MRKIVAAIIAVCFVQMGFQLYTLIEQANSDYAFVSAPAPAGRQPVAANDIVEAAFIRSTVLSDPEIQRPIYVAATHRPPAAIRSLSARTSPRPLFPTVVINIPSRERYEFAEYKPRPKMIPPAGAEAPAPHQLSAQIAEPKKRSILAKALPVVKKPYDLLKFVASKLH